MFAIKQWLQQITTMQPRCWDKNRQSQEYLQNFSNWERIYFTRKISIWLTFFLRNTPVTPNQITALWVLSGLFGACLLVADDLWLQYCGLACLYLAWILDNVDGELARYRQQFSIAGNLLDMLGHQLIPAAVFGALAVHYLLQPLVPVHLVILGIIACALVTPFIKMQENVLLLSLLEIAPHAQPAAAKDEARKSKSTYTKRLQDIAGFLFSDVAMLYLLIVAVIAEATAAYLYFYGIGLPLMMLPKYQARARKLQYLQNNPDALSAGMRPEWQDGGKS